MAFRLDKDAVGGFSRQVRDLTAPTDIEGITEVNDTGAPDVDAAWADLATAADLWVTRRTASANAHVEALNEGVLVLAEADETAARGSMEAEIVA